MKTAVFEIVKCSPVDAPSVRWTKLATSLTRDSCFQTHHVTLVLFGSEREVEVETQRDLRVLGRRHEAGAIRELAAEEGGAAAHAELLEAEDDVRRGGVDFITHF